MAMARTLYFSLLGGLLLLCSSLLWALTFDLPEQEGTVVGTIYTVQSNRGDTFSSLGLAYGIGFEAMIAANPDKELWQLGPGENITIPAQFILPAGPQKGIVINLAEMRLYYYHPDGQQVSTYPIGIGREGWETPLAQTSIVEKLQNPTWHVPESIRKASLESNHPLPKIVPPGPDNPLGQYALRLSLPGYMIHGTQFHTSIGQRSSHGCIRLWAQDIQALFEQVALGTPVRIVHQPYKVGLLNSTIYIEAHRPLPGYAEETNSQLSSIVDQIVALSRGKPYQVQWDRAQEEAEAGLGIVEVIGELTN